MRIGQARCPHCKLVTTTGAIHEHIKYCISNPRRKKRPVPEPNPKLIQELVDEINATCWPVFADTGEKFVVARPVTPRLTVSLPCWGRPARTKRAIEAILAQDTNGWEALVTGDKCPSFQKLIDSGWLEDRAKEAEAKGNKLIYSQLPAHMGSCGYHITNIHIQKATGKYIIFYANDDLILPNHFSHYLQIEDTDWDYMYFDSFLDPIKQSRISQLAPARIGHSEVIVKTSLAQKARPHIPAYGHDWEFIYDIIHNGKGAKSQSTLTTYHVMHVPNYGTLDKID